MSLLFFLKYPDEGGGEPVGYFEPYIEGVRPKKKKIYEVKKKDRRAYAEVVSLEAFTKEVFSLPNYLIRQRQEEEIIVQLLLMDEL